MACGVAKAQERLEPLPLVLLYFVLRRLPLSGAHLLCNPMFCFGAGAQRRNRTWFALTQFLILDF